MSTDRPRLSIPLDEKQHQLIKLCATLHGQTIKDYVLDRLLNDKVPNEATLRAIRDLEEGKNIKHAKTVQEMFDEVFNEEEKSGKETKD